MTHLLVEHVLVAERMVRVLSLSVTISERYSGDNTDAAATALLEIAPILDQQTQLLPYAAVVPPHDNNHYGGETRPLLIVGLIGMVVSLALLGLVFALEATSGAAGLLATISWRCT